MSDDKFTVGVARFVMEPVRSPDAVTHPEGGIHYSTSDKAALAYSSPAFGFGTSNPSR